MSAICQCGQARKATRLTLATIFILGTAHCPTGPGKAESVDLELVLAANGSGSIDEVELKFQRAGYAAAITDPDVLNAIRGGQYKKIALAYVEWGSPSSQQVIIDWMVIEGLESANEFAKRLVREPRAATGYNSISEAIAYCQRMLLTNEYKGERMIIDVSADEGNFGGRALWQARADAIAEDIVINALVIDSPDGGHPSISPDSLAGIFGQRLIGGPGSFVVVARSRTAFTSAIRRKLVLEVAGRRPRSGTTIVVAEDQLDRLRRLRRPPL